jgi:hypothetical protein
MNLFHGRVVPVLLGAALLVGTADLTAYAANGHPLLLGHGNDETRPARLANHGPGPALSLTTRAHTPPLEVGSRTKVKRLNADRVDGIDGGDVRAYTYRLHSVFTASRFAQRFPKLPAGRDYLVSYWLDTNMTVDTDALFCEIEATKLRGDPATDEIATTVSPRDFLVTNAATAVVTTRNHSVDLICATESNGKTIDSVNDGSVTFVPIGRQRVAGAKPTPAI